MRIFLFTIVLIIIAGCANQVAPSGGPKDITPPTVLDYEPDSASVLFTAKTISIKFDEYVILNDVFNQISISPPLNETPDYKLKGKTLTISIKDTLKPETTYTINFGQAIKDNTAGNVKENFTYVFSTGSYIDSLQVSGKVVDLLTAAPATKAYVVLYYEPTDTSFTTTKPYYFAKTDVSGNFLINNIKSGSYKLYAIEDQNFNYFYDLPNEKIAFQTSTLIIDSNITNQKLFLYSENKTKHNLLEAKSSRYGQTKLVFATNTSDTKINYTGSDTAAYLFTRNITNDTILFWHTNYLLDTHQLAISFDTTLIEKIIETKEFPADSNFYKSTNTFTKNVITLAQGNDPNSRAEWVPEKPIDLLFYNPVKTLTTNKITIYQDSIPLSDYTLNIDTLDSRKLRINYNWKPEKNYTIIIPEKATIDIFGLHNIADTIKLTVKKIDAFASLSTTIKNTSGSPILFQFMKSDLTVLDEFYLPTTKFENADSTYIVKQLYVIPGVYKIRAILDTDKNGKWSPGDLSQNRPPESVIFFPVDQNLRANWENEIEWHLK